LPYDQKSNGMSKVKNLLHTSTTILSSDNLIQSGVFPNLDDVDHTFYGDKPILEFSRFQSWNTMEACVRLIFIININSISDIIFLTSGKIFTNCYGIYLISLENVTILTRLKKDLRS